MAIRITKHNLSKNNTNTSYKFGKLTKIKFSLNHITNFSKFTSMRHFFTFLLLILHFTTFSQSYLRVADPNDWITTSTDNDPNWHQYIPEGQFDEISLVINPQGIYTQVEFFTTISQGNGYTWWDGNMEVIWQFRLPQQAIVHDSWLWVEGEIIKADVVDFWTASQIYEEIVDRNQDPSLLYQLPNGSYEIRIFPLPEGESRRIKMSFLLPNSWDESKITTEILLPMLQSTPLHPPQVEVIIPQNNTWQNPRLQTGTSPADIHLFTSQTSPVYGPVHYLSFPGEELVNLTQFDLKTDAPWSGNTWIQTYEDGDDKFYQLAIKPDWGEYINDSIPTDTLQNLLILIDRVNSKTSISQQTLADNIYTYLNSSQDEIASFGLMASVTDSVWFYNNDFQDNNLLNIIEATGTYSGKTEESDLEGLLTQALTFINDGNPVKKIIVFSANDAFVYPSIAEEFLVNITPLLPAETPIDIYDFQDLNVSTLYENEQEYIANHQIFHELSQATGGVLYEMRNSSQSISEALNTDAPVDVEAPIGILDLSVDLTAGICYQEQNLFSSFLYENENPTLYQTGRYLGELPFEIEAAIILEDGSYHTYETVIEPETITEGDSLMREIWYGNYLREESIIVEDEDELLQLIQQSIDERVLIPQTAFLALEPQQGGTVCVPCLDSDGGGGVIINTTEELEEKDELLIAISPNPASTIAKISLQGIKNPTSVTVEIFDAKGQAIQILADFEEVDDTTTWTWNIDSKTISGIYICRITLPDTILTQKIIVLKN